MSLRGSLWREIEELGTTAFFFGLWFLVLATMKSLVLAEYRIAFDVLSVVVLGALIVAKVVLLAEHVPLGKWLQRRAAWVDVVARTAVYGLGVFLVLLVEKAFEARHEHGGFLPSLAAVAHHRDVPHVLATTLGVTGGLVLFNLLSVARRHLGPGGLRRMLAVPLPEGPPARDRG